MEAEAPPETGPQARGVVGALSDLMGAELVWPQQRKVGTHGGSRRLLAAAVNLPAGPGRESSMHSAVQATW
jgi:hypothetical protein